VGQSKLPLWVRFPVNLQDPPKKKNPPQDTTADDLGQIKGIVENKWGQRLEKEEVTNVAAQT